MRVLLLGSIGSGKSTQAKILAKRLKICYVRSGDLIRSKAGEASVEGRICDRALHSGHLVPDAIIIPLIKEALKRRDCQKGVIFDGFVRRLSQLKVFDPRYTVVVYLKVGEEEILERLKKRERRDDIPQIINERLSVYHEETEPLINYFEKCKILVEVDGEGSIQEVTRRIEKFLQKYAK